MLAGTASVAGVSSLSQSSSSSPAATATGIAPPPTGIKDKIRNFFSKKSSQIDVLKQASEVADAAGIKLDKAINHETDFENAFFERMFTHYQECRRKIPDVTEPSTLSKVGAVLKDVGKVAAATAVGMAAGRLAHSVGMPGSGTTAVAGGGALGAAAAGVQILSEHQGIEEARHFLALFQDLSDEKTESSRTISIEKVSQRIKDIGETLSYRYQGAIRRLHNGPKGVEKLAKFFAEAIIEVIPTTGIIRDHLAGEAIISLAHGLATQLEEKHSLYHRPKLRTHRSLKTTDPKKDKEWTIIGVVLKSPLKTEDGKLFVRDGKLGEDNRSDKYPPQRVKTRLKRYEAADVRSRAHIVRKDPQAEEKKLEEAKAALVAIETKAIATPAAGSSLLIGVPPSPHATSLAICLPSSPSAGREIGTPSTVLRPEAPSFPLPAPTIKLPSPSLDEKAHALPTAPIDPKALIPPVPVPPQIAPVTTVEGPTAALAGSSPPALTSPLSLGVPSPSAHHAFSPGIDRRDSQIALAIRKCEEAEEKYRETKREIERLIKSTTDKATQEVLKAKNPQSNWYLKGFNPFYSLFATPRPAKGSFTDKVETPLPATSKISSYSM